MKREILNARSNLDSLIEQKPKLLLVDENSEDLQHYTAMLRYLGYDVQPAGSYTDAVKYLQHEVFDLVMVDQGSTNFEGRSVLRRAVEIDHQTPVLVLTGAVNARCCVNALDLGASEYVQKPLTSSEVNQMVEEYLHPFAKLGTDGEDLMIYSNVANREFWRKAS